MFRTFAAFFALSIVLISPASAQEAGFQVKCEPTEVSDIGRVIRTKIYNDLALDKTIKEKTIEVKVSTRDKNATVKTIPQLLDGSGLYFNPKTLDIAVGGESLGHACFATADVRIYVKIKRKDGTGAENTVLSTLQIPGAYATKSKVTVVATGQPK